MLKYNTIIICLFGILTAQKLPYGEPKYFKMDSNEKLQQITVSVPSTISQNIIENIQPVQYQVRDYYYLKIRLDKSQPVHFKLIKSHFTDEMIVYFIDLEINGWVGPYSIQILKNNSNPISGGLNTQNILIEISAKHNKRKLAQRNTFVAPSLSTFENAKQKSIFTSCFSYLFSCNVTI